MPATYRLPDGSQLLISATYSAGEKRGVIILVLVSFFSLFAVVGLLCALAISAFNTRKSRDDQLFIRSHLAAYFISLLVCNLIQAISSIINTAWVHNMGVIIGPTCSMQGLLTQTADVGIAVWTMVISGHAFCHLFLDLRARRNTFLGVLICGWSIIAVSIVLGPATVNMEKSGPFYNIAGHTCWISPHYKAQQAILDRLIMFFVAVLSVISSLLVFSQPQEKLARNGRRNTLSQSNGRDAADGDDYPSKGARFSRQMLAYPASYVVIVLPLVISQFALWAGNKVPFEVSTFCMFVFLLSGPVNTILFIVILPLSSGSLRIGHQESSLEIPKPASPHARQGPGEVGGHRRAGSNDTLVSVPKKMKLRPPEIIITRDSIDSVYSVYHVEEEEEVRPVVQSVPQSAPAKTNWSAGWIPRRRLPV